MSALRGPGWWLVAGVALAGGAGAWSCGDDAPARRDPAPRDAAPPPPDAELPADPGDFGPSFARVAEGETIDTAALADMGQCETCHQDVAAQWRQSPHAQASFGNPYYRASVDRFREETSHQASQFCGACHDAALLFDGAMRPEVRPEDPRAHVGVTCMTCHGITEATTDGNGSYTLTTRPVPLPRSGDPESVRRHRERVALDPLRTAQLCGSCHRAFLGPTTGNPTHLPGMDNLTGWQRSVYAGSHGSLLDDEDVGEKTCQQCHMQTVRATLGDLSATRDGVVVSHRFAAAQTALADLIGDPVQLEETRANLRRAATVDVAVAWNEGGEAFTPAERAPVVPGETLRLDVVVRNTGAGHRFPDGTRDSQDTWLEVVVEDRRGVRVAEAGTRHGGTDGEDLEAHRFRAVVADEHGHPALERDVHRFRGLVYDWTIEARDAQVVRYALDVPARFDRGRLPLTVTTKLRHRRHGAEMQRAACAASRSERGRAFDAAAVGFGRYAMDACREQPTTEIASAVIEIGRPVLAAGSATPAEREWQRMYDHGLGMTHAMQERLDEARPSLTRALELAPTARRRAMTLALLARVEGRQGRVDEALATVAAAEELVGDHPALARTRGDALAVVWRWQDAAAAYAIVAQRTPHDDRAWADLALARGSAGDEAGALDAAVRGLRLSPREESLLRSQALALTALGQRDEEAREAFLSFRRPDGLPGIRSRCNRDVPGCARERVPVHEHRLRLLR